MNNACCKSNKLDNWALKGWEGVMVLQRKKAIANYLSLTAPRSLAISHPKAALGVAWWAATWQFQMPPPDSCICFLLHSVGNIPYQWCSAPHTK